MKLPQPRDSADPSFSFKFIENPIDIDNIDDLYDLFDLHRNEPHKYICMVKNIQSEPKDFSLQNKMFRKFFYENSAPIEDLMTFVEVTTPSLALKLGLSDVDQVVVVQNTNRYHTLPTEFKLVNLQLERSEPFKEILNSTLKERLGDDYFTELTSNEIFDQLVFGENEEENSYQKFCAFMESSLLPQEGEANLIFAPTTKALRFYRSYFKRQLYDVLFVSVNDPDDPESIINLFNEDSTAKN